MNVSVQDMMDARERRAARQAALLQAYPGQSLLSFTMNIPGPEKDSPLIRQGAALGRRLLEKGFLRLGVTVTHAEHHADFTGSESFYVLPLSPEELKRMCTDIEEAAPVGRVFDLDVLFAGGYKLERGDLGLPDRRCLLCRKPARLCARSRAHSVEELREKTDALLREALRDEVKTELARLACQALLYEVNVTPKPGLVDRVNSGSHRDMDIYSFAASTAALYPYFARCAELGHEQAALPAPLCFRTLREPGRMAEGEMLAATGGVNTHKGAIFSLGLLCAAAGRLGRAHWAEPERLLDECAAMTHGLSAADFAGLTPENARTTGQRLYLERGITGVRGEAEQGFPLVRNVGLPKLEAALEAGLSLNDAGCAALLAIMAQNTDTNVIHRGGFAALEELRRTAAELLEAEPFPSAPALEMLDEALIARRLSPGGSADLLALCFLLHLLREAGVR